MDATPAAAATGMKPTTVPTAPQPTKIATPPLTGIGKSQFHHYHKPQLPKANDDICDDYVVCCLQAPRPPLLGLVANLEV